jgi:hypothetical protein
MKLCIDPTCPEPATYRGRCAVHSREHERGQRSTSAKRVYNSKRWRIVRRHQLFEHPICACGAIATDVDHLQDIEDGGDPWSASNLSSKCHSCHSRKTRARQCAA